MKPAGSIRRTRASSGFSPPHCSTMARAPAFDANRVRRQQVRHDFQLPGSPISRSGSPAGTTVSLSRSAFEHDAVDWRRHAHDAARRLERRRRQARLRALQLRRGGANRERGGVGGFLGDMDIRLVRLEFLLGDDAIVGKRPDAGEVPLRLVQRRLRALLFRARAAERGPGALDAGLRLGAGSRIEQRRRFRAHARDHLAALHAVAGVQLDSKHPAGHGSGHDEPIAHARHPFFVDRHDQRSARDDGDIDLRPSSATCTTASRPAMTAAEPRTRRLASRRNIGITPAS